MRVANIVFIFLFFTVYVFSADRHKWNNSALYFGYMNDSFHILERNNGKKVGGGEFNSGKIGYLHALDNNNIETFPSLWLDMSVLYGTGGKAIVKKTDDFKYLSFNASLVKRFYFGGSGFYIASKGGISSDFALSQSLKKKENINAFSFGLNIAGQIGYVIGKNHEINLEFGYKKGMSGDYMENDKQVTNIKPDSSGKTIYLGYVYHFNDDYSQDVFIENNNKTNNKKIIKKEPIIDINKKNDKQSYEKDTKEIAFNIKDQNYEEAPKKPIVHTSKEYNTEIKMELFPSQNNKYIDVLIANCHNALGVCKKIKIGNYNNVSIFYIKLDENIVKFKKTTADLDLKGSNIIKSAKFGYDKIRQYPIHLVIKTLTKIKKIQKIDIKDTELYLNQNKSLEINKNSLVYRIYL